VTKTVLLTGATGFVGRQVLNLLIERGIQVRLIVREESQNELLQKRVNEKIITTLDIFSENENWWYEACRGIDTVIHVAWYVKPGKYQQSEKNLTCVSGTIELGKACVRAGVRRFVGVGTCFEYDLNQGTLTVDSPLNPLTPYAASKAAIFLILSQWFSLHNIEFSWCRLFYLFGEGENDDRLVPYIKRQLEAGQPAQLTNGSQIRDFLDVVEAGEKIVEVALAETQGAINICSGIPITIRQLAEQIADVYGRRDLLQFGARANNLVEPPRIVGIPNS